MRYDDRLSTVLRLTPVSKTVARIQFRQLIDLLGTCPSEARSETIDAAYGRLTELSFHIPAADRTAILRERGLRLRSPRLVASLARHEAPVAEAALQAADLGEQQWLDLIPALPVPARALIGNRADLGEAPRALLARLGVGSRALPGAAGPLPSAQVIPIRAEPEPQPIAGIGAIVRRIEAFRRAREASSQPAATNEAPRLPLEDAASAGIPRLLASFDFTADGEGRLRWADPVVAPMVVGHSLGESPVLREAIRLHQPLRGLAATLDGAPAISGLWQIDAAPRFDPASGRFTGYAGRARRLTEGSDQAASSVRPSDRLRQVLHELRTPVNAIQGFAEIIQQQLFGPSPHEYRALAASIAADAAHILAGFEELERYARLETGAMALTEGEADLGACLAATMARLEPYLAPRGSGFACHADAGAMPVPLAAIEAERLCWRLLVTLAATLAAGERLELELRRHAGEVQLALELPRALATLDDTALFHTSVGVAAQAPSAGMFGTGFALRLAREEARAAGGRMERHGDAVLLCLPDLTGAAADHTPPPPEGGIQAASPAA